MSGPGRVVVVGSVNADVVVSASVLPQPGETVPGRSIEILPGGKGLNQAVAASRAGASAVLVACVGSDGWGDEAVSFLEGTAVDRSWLKEVDTSMGTAVVTVDADGTNTIVVVPGANAMLTGEHTAAAVEEVGAGGVVVAQLEVPHDAVAAAFAAARRVGATSVLNPSPVGDGAAALVEVADVVVVNEVEARALDIGPRPGRAVVITLGERGAEVHADGEVHTVAARRARPVDTTGAGDCFLGVMAAGLATGRSLADSARAAGVAASLQVERTGAASAMPFEDEVAAALAAGE
ncbi:MAG: ribokinase [Actinobacteria bacterium]|nr:ribokinase [Actinomycetota bacterium]